jgi:hypothetical protein
MAALTPLCGSKPACAARPCTTTSYREVPLRAVLSAPSSSADASSTKAAAHPRTDSSISCREVAEPTSSSPLTTTHTPSGEGREARAWNICTRPAFMSRTPGPRAIPSATDQGWFCSEPMDHTVSWCPTSRTRGAPKRHRRWVTPPITITSGRAPNSRAPRAPTTSALRATAAWSAEKDSHSTRSSRSASIAGNASEAPRVIGPAPSQLPFAPTHFSLGFRGPLESGGTRLPQSAAG